MLHGYYGKEPFDLRLTVLRMLGQWKKIVLWTLAGTLLLGGAYCLKNILLRGEKQYRAVSVYRVDYGVDDIDANLVMINSYTWNTYVHTEEFLKCVRDRLAGSEWAALSNEELGGCLQGDMESDWRVPSTIVLSGNAEMSTAVAKAVEETMTLDFPGEISEIKSIRVLDHAGEAEELVPDIRVGRAFTLAAVLSLFAVIVVLLLKETGDDSIWLPATLAMRYGLQCVGTVNSVDLKENLRYLFGGKKQIAICPVQEACDPSEALKEIESLAGETEGSKWYAVPSPLLCPETAEKLREAEAVLLLVNAGAHAGKQLEYVLDFLAKQDCKATAALLWNADEKLIRRYYGFTCR